MSNKSVSFWKQHLARCKALPDSVRAVLDHAAVCESRAGLGLYGGRHASVHRGFRVTGCGVNECRRCGKVVRGWGADLKKHIDRCHSGAAAPVGACSMGIARAPDGRGTAGADASPNIPTSSTVVAKRRRPVATTRDVSADAAQASRSCLPCTRGGGGSGSDSGSGSERGNGSDSGSGSGSSNGSRALQPAQPQETQTARGTSGGGGAVPGGVAWAHGFTMTGSGLKVPLAPMPSRCKRARRERVTGGSASATHGCGGYGVV